MKTAIITGASTGIGKACAELFGARNFHVYLVARDEERLDKVKADIENNGGKATVAVVDLSKVHSINTLIDEIKNGEEKIDAIIHIAGIWHGENEVYANTNYDKFSQQTILDTYAVGLTAPALLIHGLLPLMISGKIVNLSGTFKNGAKGWLPYFSSKRGLEDFTVGLAQELEDRDIQVNCVSPSDTATKAYEKYFPEYMNDAIDPKEIAEKILELCDEENKTTGKIIVMKKGKNPFNDFHH